LNDAGVLDAALIQWQSLNIRDRWGGLLKSTHSNQPACYANVVHGKNSRYEVHKKAFAA
jgi:hypothetical protein